MLTVDTCKVLYGAEQGAGKTHGWSAESGIYEGSTFALAIQAIRRLGLADFIAVYGTVPGPRCRQRPILNGRVCDLFRGPMSDQKELQDSRIEEALSRVLDSGSFASSKQSQALLKYLVAHSQAEEDGSLKERMIGVNVFGRSSDYNTGDDPIVRARVGEVRKRLARYYQSELTDRPTVRFSIPTGSYRVAFDYADAGQDTSEYPRDELESALTEERQSGPFPWLRRRAPEKAAQRFLSRGIILLAAGCAGGAVVMGAISHHEFHRASVVEAFWSPLLASSQPVVIYLGQNCAYMPTASYMKHIRESRPPDEDVKRGTEVELDDLRPGERLEAGDVYVENHDLVSAGNIAASIQIASLLGSLHRTADVRTGEGLSAEDLVHTSAVFVGAFNNKWTMQVSQILPFRFEVIEGETNAIVEQAGKRRVWVTHMVGPHGAANEEYAIVARLASSLFRKPAIVAAGLRSRGTRAAGDFITDPTELSKFLETAPPDWRKRNLEVVLRVEVVKGVPGTAHPIAFSVW
jgi:hypothetical protein